MAHQCKLLLFLPAVFFIFQSSDELCWGQFQSSTQQHQSFSRTDNYRFQPNPSSTSSRYINTASYPTSTWNDTQTHSSDYHVIADAHSTYLPDRIDSARRTFAEFQSRSSPNSVVAELITTNASLVAQWLEIAARINALASRVALANSKYQRALRDYEETGSKLSQYVSIPSTSVFLAHKRHLLDDWQLDGTAGLYTQDDLQKTRQNQLESELLRFDGRDLVRQSNELLASMQLDATRQENYALVVQVQNLLRERREWLQLLKQAYDDYRQKLGDLDSASTALNKLTADYRKLINRHVIWIRSNDPLGFSDLQKSRTGLASVFNSRRSLDLGYALQQKWQSNPASGITLLVSVVAILLIRSLAKHWLIGIGKRKVLRDSNSSTRKCAAAFLTPIVALCIPGVIYVIARWLGTGFVTESTLHVSSGLYAASLIGLAVEMPRQLLRRFGFVEKHLHIELPRQQRAGIYLRTIGVGLVLLAYIVTFAERVDRGAWSGSFARLGFVAAMIVVACTAHFALKPKRGFLEPIIEKFGGRLFHRIRVVFYFLAVGFPILMIGFSSLGYAFTASEIIQRAAIMLAAILIATTLWATIKILSSGAWHRLTGTRDERALDDYETAPTTRVSGTLAEHSLELKHQIAFLSQCALALGAIFCIGWLWIDVFPNVRMGNPIVWTVQETTNQTFLDSSGQQITRSQSEATPITVLHLALAAATLFLAFQLAKLLPSIFDALVLQRVNFDEAMEHLSLMLGRCLLFGVGCFIACRTIGLRWETIQWLVVGLSIGLGFGLQEVVKNLLGGMVVLFEKPARLGDLITVGNVTGRVASQKLRTTTLSDESGREVIVPNKQFVSQAVVNWMGAGRLKAVAFEVNVSRDERPADVCRMLQHLMVEQPELLLSPAPQATLVCVGQNTQRIELLGWVDENCDATIFRNSLSMLVRSFLTEKNLLATEQPPQLSLTDLRARSSERTGRIKNRRSA